MTILYTRPALWRLRLFWLAVGLLFGASISLALVLFMMMNSWAIILVPEIEPWRNLL